MRSFRIHLAALAAVLMLTGCSDNNSLAEPEITSSPEVTGTTGETGEITETNQTSKSTDEADGITGSTGSTETPEQSYSSAETPPEGDNSQNTGISLVSGEYSDNTLIFNLRGRYCDFSELPFSVQTYQPDLPEDQEFTLQDVCNGKMILRQEIADADVQLADERFQPVRLYTYDLKTGTLTQIFSSLEPLPDSEGAITYNPIYADDKYLAAKQDKGGEEFLTVFSHDENRAVLSLPLYSDNCTFLHSDQVCIAEDYLYFDGEYTIPEYEKTVLAAFRASLQNGRVELISAGLWSPQYGVGNVCFSVALNQMRGYTNLRGDNFLPETSTGVQTIFTDTYYPIEVEPVANEILGERYHVRWNDKFNIYREIGTTGFGYKPYYFNAHITRDGIYLIKLLHEESGGENNRTLIGVCDTKTGENTAALIEPAESQFVIADNTAIYIVNGETLETTVLAKNSESY